MVRGGMFDYGDDDPWTGAVRIWAEGVLVFCRFFEMLSRGCCKSKWWLINYVLIKNIRTEKFGINIEILYLVKVKLKNIN